MPNITTPVFLPASEADKSCVTDIIDAKTQEIRPQDDEVYSKMEDLADDLPESSPRFILLSYPMTTVSCLSKIKSRSVLRHTLY